MLGTFEMSVTDLQHLRHLLECEKAQPEICTDQRQRKLSIVLRQSIDSDPKDANKIPYCSCSRASTFSEASFQSSSTGTQRTWTIGSVLTELSSIDSGSVRGTAAEAEYEKHDVGEPRGRRPICLSRLQTTQPTEDDLWMIYDDSHSLNASRHSSPDTLRFALPTRTQEVRTASASRSLKSVVRLGTQPARATQTFILRLDPLKHIHLLGQPVTQRVFELLWDVEARRNTATLELSRLIHALRRGPKLLAAPNATESTTQPALLALPSINEISLEEDERKSDDAGSEIVVTIHGDDATVGRIERDTAMNLTQGSLALQERQGRIRWILEMAEKAFPNVYAKFSKLKALHDSKRLRRSTSTPNTSPSTLSHSIRGSKSAEIIRTEATVGPPQEGDNYQSQQSTSNRWLTLNGFGGNQGFPSQLPGRAPQRRSPSRGDGDGDENEGGSGSNVSSGKDGKTSMPIYHCVYLGSSSQELQACSTRHDFVSQLKTHHGCRAHSFFYCPRCFETFPNEGALSAHGHRECRGKICLLSTCSRYGQELQQSCMHNDGRVGNTQTMQWQKLFSLARPGETVPDPSTSINPRPRTPNPAAGPSQSSASSFAYRVDAEEYSLHPRICGSTSASPVTESQAMPESQRLDVVQLLLARDAQLRPLARNLLEEASTNRMNVSDLSRDAFEASRGRLARDYPTSGPVEAILRSRVDNLEVLILHLYRWVSEPSNRHQPQWEALRGLAQAATSPSPMSIAMYDHSTLQVPSHPPSAPSQSGSDHGQSHSGNSATASQAPQAYIHQPDQPEHNLFHGELPDESGIWSGQSTSPSFEQMANVYQDQMYNSQGSHFLQTESFGLHEEWNNNDGNTAEGHAAQGPSTYFEGPDYRS